MINKMFQPQSKLYWENVNVYEHVFLFDKGFYKVKMSSLSSGELFECVSNLYIPLHCSLVRAVSFYFYFRIYNVNFVLC